VDEREQDEAFRFEFPLPSTALFASLFFHVPRSPNSRKSPRRALWASNLSATFFMQAARLLAAFRGASAAGQGNNDPPGALGALPDEAPPEIPHRSIEVYRRR
jgi:hypothetical protein